jgi:hypothetical protein
MALEITTEQFVTFTSLDDIYTPLNGLPEAFVIDWLGTATDAHDGCGHKLFNTLMGYGTNQLIVAVPQVFWYYLFILQ